MNGTTPQQLDPRPSPFIVASDTRCPKEGSGSICLEAPMKEVLSDHPGTDRRAAWLAAAGVSLAWSVVFWIMVWPPAPQPGQSLPPLAPWIDTPGLPTDTNSSAPPPIVWWLGEIKP